MLVSFLAKFLFTHMYASYIQARVICSARHCNDNNTLDRYTKKEENCYVEGER